MPGYQLYNEPLEERYTTWFNPLGQDQKVDIFHGDDRRPTRYVIRAGEELQIPSRFDYAIHKVENGVVIGGLAPQLVNRGSDAKLDPALDTNATAKAQADAAAQMASVAKQAADDALILAEAKAQRAAAEKAELDKRAAAKPEQKKA